MRVFIFGAGASYGAHRPHGNLTPDLVAPLVDQLFNPQYDKFTRELLTQDQIDQCRKGIAETQSLEKWLTDRWERIDSFPDPKAQDAEKAFFGRVAFSLWFLFQRVSTYELSADSAYDILLKKLLKERHPGLISFNYDTLLDRAIQRRYGQPLSSLQDYLDFGFIKPHGSVNWLMPRGPGSREFDSGASFDPNDRLLLAVSSIYNSPPLPTGNIVVYDPSHNDLNSVNQLLGRFGYFYPVLFMPLTTKLYSLIEGFDKKIISKGREILGKASEIYLVGYKAKDEIIKDMFQEAKPGTRLNVVGDETAKVVMTSVLQWASQLEEGSICANGFRDFALMYGEP